MSRRSPVRWRGAPRRRSKRRRRRRPLENVIDSRPAGNTHIDAQQIQRTGTAQAGEALSRTAPGVTLESSSGNPVSPDIEYRGFLASPTSGTPQGLAIYQNGVRINEAFGDEVNWELIPTLAIASMDLVANNPAFGLNALGGALNVRMKDGFSYHGGKLDVSGGSYGRAQAGGDYGSQVGQYAFYGALEYFHDDFYRYFSNSNVRRFYGDLGYRNDGNEIHLDIGLRQFRPRRPRVVADPDAGAKLGADLHHAADHRQPDGHGQPQRSVHPEPDLDADRQRLCAPLRAEPCGRQPSNAQACDAGNNLICFGDGTTPANGLNGQQIQNAALYNAGVANALGEIDRTGVATTSMGSAFQLNNSDSIFGYKNHFSFGGSFDYGMTSFAGSAELGVVAPIMWCRAPASISARPEIRWWTGRPASTPSTAISASTRSTPSTSTTSSRSPAARGSISRRSRCSTSWGQRFRRA